MHLGFLGAEVIKIESSLRPGLGRRLPIYPPDVEETLNTSAYFNQWDQGKLSCELDLSQPGSIEIVKKLVAQSDVILENFATGVMDRLGLSFGVLQEINPRIVVASISGYGSTGPFRHFMGYGPTTGPLSGLSSLTGYVDGGPRELGIAAHNALLDRDGLVAVVDEKLKAFVEALRAKKADASTDQQRVA